MLKVVGYDLQDVGHHIRGYCFTHVFILVFMISLPNTFHAASFSGS